MVSYKVGHLDPPSAFLRFEVSLNLHFIFRIPKIYQKHIKMEHGIGGDHTSCKKQNNTMEFMSCFLKGSNVKGINLHIP